MGGQNGMGLRFCLVRIGNRKQQRLRNLADFVETVVKYRIRLRMTRRRDRPSVKGVGLENAEHPQLRKY